MSTAHWPDEVETVERGRLRLCRVGASLSRWFDHEVLKMALSEGAVECRFPATITRETLARAGYFDAFPGGATAIDAVAADATHFLPPAVCYHAYDWLRDATLDGNLVLTASQSCFREADRGAASPARLWDFTMREVVFVGARDWVAERIGAWQEHAGALSRRAGLDGAFEPATDMFFGTAARGQQLLQQIKGLKIELRMSGPAGERIAVASFNRHETFFSSRFGIAGAGDAVHSGCAAFGLERWALVFLNQRGAAAGTAMVADN